MALIYLDASFALDLLDPTAARYALSRAEFSGITRYAVSELVRIELSIRPFRNQDLQALATVDGFIQRGLLLPLDEATARMAVRLRADHGLKTVDALHLALAERHGCNEFWTYDARLARVPSAVTVRTPV